MSRAVGLRPVGVRRLVRWIGGLRRSAAARGTAAWGTAAWGTAAWGTAASRGIAEPGVTDEELSAWHQAHPSVVLPAGLVELYRRANGFRVRPDANTTRGLVYLLPLRKVAPAAQIMYGDAGDDVDLPDSWFALMADADSAVFAVLDAAAGVYLKVDPIDADDPDTIGPSVEDLLDWAALFF